MMFARDKFGLFSRSRRHAIGAAGYAKNAIKSLESRQKR